MSPHILALMQEPHHPRSELEKGFKFPTSVYETSYHMEKSNLPHHIIFFPRRGEGKLLHIQGQQRLCTEYQHYCTFRAIMEYPSRRP